MCPDIAHLKAHEGDLSGANIDATFGNRNTGHVVGVTMQELLLAIREALDDDSASQGIEQVLSVRVDSQTRGNVACWKKSPSSVFVCFLTCSTGMRGIAGLEP